MATPEAVAIPRWQVRTGWVLSCLPLLAFLPSAIFKLVQPGEFLAEWSKNYPPATARPLGVVELSCVLLYFVPATRVLGAILLTGYLGGAIATHVHAGQAIFVVPLLIGIMVWGGSSCAIRASVSSFRRRRILMSGARAPNCSAL